jgi:hypothetical protein
VRQSANTSLERTEKGDRVGCREGCCRSTVPLAGSKSSPCTCLLETFAHSELPTGCE